jgi:hypothetical protein
VYRASLVRMYAEFGLGPSERIHTMAGTITDRALDPDEHRHGGRLSD